MHTCTFTTSPSMPGCRCLSPLKRAYGRLMRRRSNSVSVIQLFAKMEPGSYTL
jgi:3-hydroxymyristoyl/3-hydroxydecanoyl-(acyl carrier protein) dehydratase